jgi:glucose/mannose-6-phosphate isomerase
MLDNIYDKSELKKVIDSMPEQVRESYGSEVRIKLKGAPDNILICGMGGSGIAGQILRSYAENSGLKIPIFTINDYAFPSYVTKNSLFIISSYSGNTEETISCYKEASRKGHNIIVITSGGKLMEYATRDKNALIALPKGLQPRNALAYLFFPILKIMENNGLIENQSSFVKNLIDSLHKNAKKFNEEAEALAGQLDERIPVIYSSTVFSAVAYRWKTQFNENAKTIATYHVFPELDHNELNGFKNCPWPLHVIILKDERDHRRVQKRMNITKNLIKEVNPEVKFTEITIRGDDLLTRLFSAVLLGDLTSFYLAMKYATDPTPVDIIEKLKKEMGPFVL